MQKPGAHRATTLPGGFRSALRRSIKHNFVAGRLGNLIREAARQPYLYDGTPNPERRVSLGESVTLNDALLNVVSGDITIGDHSFMGHGVSLLTGTHDFRAPRTERQSSSPAAGRDIVIGKGVWIASNATVLGPCTIGDDAVVAAGAVVTMREVPAGTIVGGVPAKILGRVEPGDAPAS
jgi:acetyltransferase-like isoleucine patch superfamily enzyme